MQMPSHVVGLKGTVQQEILLTESKILFLFFPQQVRQDKDTLYAFENVVRFTKFREILLLVTHLSINMSLNISFQVFWQSWYHLPNISFISRYFCYNMFSSNIQTSSLCGTGLLSATRPSKLINGCQGHPLFCLSPGTAQRQRNPEEKRMNAQSLYSVGICRQSRYAD